MHKLPNQPRALALGTALAIALALAPFGAGAATKYEDPILTLGSTPEVVEKGTEADAYSLTVMAYNWGYPLVRMERTMREYVEVESPRPPTSYRAPLNQMGWATQLATPAARDMPTANNDTLYTSTVLQLDQPYILTVPDTHNRYYVIDVFNMWHPVVHGRPSSAPGRLSLEWCRLDRLQREQHRRPAAAHD